MSEENKPMNRRTCENCYYRTTCEREIKDLSADIKSNPAITCDAFKQCRDAFRNSNVYVNGMGHQIMG